MPKFYVSINIEWHIAAGNAYIINISYHIFLALLPILLYTVTQK